MVFFPIFLFSFVLFRYTVTVTVILTVTLTISLTVTPTVILHVTQIPFTTNFHYNCHVSNQYDKPFERQYANSCHIMYYSTKKDAYSLLPFFDGFLSYRLV